MGQKMDEKTSDVQNGKRIREKNIRLAMAAIENLHRDELMFIMVAMIQKFNKHQLLFAIEDAAATLGRAKK
jgi:hypothetical protein